jgi:hypothetical protein
MTTSELASRLIERLTDNIFSLCAHLPSKLADHMLSRIGIVARLIHLLRSRGTANWQALPRSEAKHHNKPRIIVRHFSALDPFD